MTDGFAQIKAVQIMFLNATLGGVWPLDMRSSLSRDIAEEDTEKHDEDCDILDLHGLRDKRSQAIHIAYRLPLQTHLTRHNLRKQTNELVLYKCT